MRGVGLTVANPMVMKKLIPHINAKSGRIGYILAWLMGVPASVLLVIFLIRGG